MKTFVKLYQQFRFFLITSVITISFSFIHSAAFAEDFKLAYSRPLNSFYGQYLNMIYTEGFKRIGHNLVYTEIPSKRGIADSDRGKNDGQMSRIKAFGKAHPNLILVDAPLLNLDFVAYSHNPDLKLEGWESLKSGNYKVEYRAGVAIAKNNLSKFLTGKNLKTYKNTELGLKKLLAKRMDLLIDVEGVILSTIDNQGLDKSKLHRVGLMERIFTYPYLHKKHSDIVPKLAAALNAMRDEGLFEKYRQIAETATK